MTMIPEWITITFIFAIGACVGSFLNVVIYRMPRDLSIVHPGSACPGCKNPIAFYDNIPLLSWLLLLGKCRKCKTPISPRYFIVELFTAVVFVGFYLLYFRVNIRTGLGGFLDTGYFLYIIQIIMLAAFIAASAIDLELQVIPLSICWLVTAVGIIGSALAVFVYDPVIIRSYDLFPSASAKVAALSAGALLGLLTSLLLLFTGIIKTSYTQQCSDIPTPETENQPPITYKHRLEMLKETIFLLPIVLGAFIAYKVYEWFPGFQNWWIDFSQVPVIAGLFGSLWGYFIGCAVVWATRILGTLAFGREAMGLGDVHLMGAAGAVIGPWPVVTAFFIAPFFGLVWAFICMFFKKIRQIPYGPFLSIGVFVVMILHDTVMNWLQFVFYR
ncbi:MAG: prepilin peptidase [Planctomycetaceae bacterium]|nr:prepilin peptidase [Planctomycetaceae bacterium]